MTKKAGNGVDNGIPLCYLCHATIDRYNEQCKRGNKYKPEELKARRNQVYEEYTRDIVPPIDVALTTNFRNNPKLKYLPPKVATAVAHQSDTHPVRVRIKAKVAVGGDEKGLVDDRHGYYDGRIMWNMNPRDVFFGSFNIKKEYAEQASEKELVIEIGVTVIDELGREHQLLSRCWRYVGDGKNQLWNPEPVTLAEWIRIRAQK